MPIQLSFLFNVKPYVKDCLETKGRKVFVTLSSEIKNPIYHVLGFLSDPLTHLPFLQMY